MIAWNVIDAPAHFFIMFEVLVLIAAVIGIMFGRGRFRDGPGLALLAISGTVLVCSVLGYTAAGRVMSGYSLTPYVLARAGASGVFAMLAAWTVLARRPGVSLPLLGKGLAAGVLGCGCIAGAYAIRSNLAGWSPVLLVPVALIGFALVLGLIAAGVHYTIRAFELGMSNARL